MTPLATAAAIGAAFGLGFWAGGRWWLYRFAVAVITGTSPLADRLKKALDASPDGVQ